MDIAQAIYLPKIYFLHDGKLVGAEPCALVITDNFQQYFLVRNFNDGGKYKIDINHNVFSSEEDLLNKMILFLEKADYSLPQVQKILEPYLQDFTSNSIPSNLAQYPYKETWIKSPIALKKICDARPDIKTYRGIKS